MAAFPHSRPYGKVLSLSLSPSLLPSLALPNPYLRRGNCTKPRDPDAQVHIIQAVMAADEATAGSTGRLLRTQ